MIGDWCKNSIQLFIKKIAWKDFNTHHSCTSIAVVNCMASYLLPIQCAVHLHPRIGIWAAVFRPFLKLIITAKDRLRILSFFLIPELHMADIMSTHLQLTAYLFEIHTKRKSWKIWIEIFAVWEFYWFTQRWISNCTNQVITELRLVCRTQKHKIMSAKLSLSITFITTELMRMQFGNADVRVYCE